MTYRVTHRTTYRYEGDVSSSYGQMHLLPRDLPGQTSHGTHVVIEPVPEDYRERRDFFGNWVAFFSILSPHRTLSVTATTEVDVSERNHGGAALTAVPWEQVRDALDAGASDEAVLDARQYTLDSPLVATSDNLADYGRRSFPPGRPVLEALRDLAHRIHADYEYEAGATTVTTTAEEALTATKGVCQDFAHLAIGCLRSLGLAARYVSGYLETAPPPGSPRLVGADVSHAWAALFVPSVGWVDVDPTNDQMVDDGYVTTAWGRDYSDVPPMKGVIYTEGLEHELEVSVDVVRIG